MWPVYKMEYLHILIYAFAILLCEGSYQPEQVHLSYDDNPTHMVVTWSTMNDTEQSLPMVNYGSKRVDRTITGYSTRFTDGGPLGRVQFIHRVTMINLIPGQLYWYRCGSSLGWSDVFYFRALKNGTSWSPKFILFGDLGSENAQSLPSLQTEAQTLNVDVIIHVGDFAYDMDTNNAEVGDEFMRQIQPIAAYAPYMTCVGNHEQAYNFSNYKNRFSMPGSENNLMFSFNVGPVHFISVSTEFYFFLQYGLKQVVKQFKWLEKDLQKATEPENRAQRPWIILYGHRPMYCSNNDGDDCTHRESIVRVGVPVLHWYGLEPILYKYGIDLAVWAHEHSYERLWPVYDNQIYNGSYDAPYVNPKATVHITTGSAGNLEKKDAFQADAPPWTAFRTTDYGYTRMQVFNSSHLYLEQTSIEKGGVVIDHVWIVKDSHGPFSNISRIHP